MEKGLLQEFTRPRGGENTRQSRGTRQTDSTVEGDENIGIQRTSALVPTESIFPRNAPSDGLEFCHECTDGKISTATQREV